MTIALELFCCIFLFLVPWNIKFFTCIGVNGCGCIVSSNVVCTTMEYLDLINRYVQSTSEAYSVPFLIICDMVRIAPLLSLWLNFSAPKIKCPPAHLRV